MSIRNNVVERPEEATHPDTLKAALAEFISTLIFVLVGSSSSIAYNKLTNDGATTPAGLISASLAHAIALFVAVSVSANISLLLRFVTGLTVPAFRISSGIGVGEALVLEIMMTFGLLPTVYAATIDPKNYSLGTIAPITISVIMGANILMGGAFTGASMSPAVSFEPAVVSWSGENH